MMSARTFALRAIGSSGRACAAARTRAPSSTALGRAVGRRHGQGVVAMSMSDLPQKTTRDIVEGARDPFAGEIGTGFGEKVLGNPDTEHMNKPPEKIKDIVGLAKKKCVPCEGGAKALEEGEAELLRKQTPGWKLLKGEDGVPKLKCEWKMRNFVKGLDFFQRVAEVAEAEGHHPDLHLVGWNQVRTKAPARRMRPLPFARARARLTISTTRSQVSIEVYTHAVNGLTENDFILAAKINEIDTSDLMPKKKKKFWA